MVEFPCLDRTCRGHLALPPSGRGRGVVVIQEWWGLVPHIESVCDRLAGEGFVALAPDLYDGRTTFEPDEAQKEAMNLDMDRALATIDAAVSHLAGSSHVVGDGIGVAGFCMGGRLALAAAAGNPGLTACVVYYGARAGSGVTDLSGMTASVLAHWGERDHSYDHETVEQLERRLREAGVSIASFWYDAGHAFFNDDRPAAYDAAAAQLSWDRTLAFLEEHLGG